MDYRIPCQHYTGAVPLTTSVPDHTPLSHLQVETLCEAAMEADTSTLDSILDRLVQGIPGMTCPRPYLGPDLMSQKLTWLERFFWEQKGHWTDPAVVAAIAALMTE